MLSELKLAVAQSWERNSATIGGVTGVTTGAWSLWFDQLATGGGKVAAVGGAILTMWAMHDKLKKDTRWYPRLLRRIFG